MSGIKVVENNNKWDFEREVTREIKNEKVMDIKFAVASDIHSDSFGGSYSSGERYYAMIIFE